MQEQLKIQDSALSDLIRVGSKMERQISQQVSYIFVPACVSSQPSLMETDHIGYWISKNRHHWIRIGFLISRHVLPYSILGNVVHSQPGKCLCSILEVFQ